MYNNVNMLMLVVVDIVLLCSNLKSIHNAEIILLFIILPVVIIHSYIYTIL